MPVSITNIAGSYVETSDEVFLSIEAESDEFSNVCSYSFEVTRDGVTIFESDIVTLEAGASRTHTISDPNHGGQNHQYCAEVTFNNCQLTV